MSMTQVFSASHPCYYSLTDLQIRLWPLTYRHAESTLYYRDRFAGRSSRKVSCSVPQLDSLPVTRREDLQQAGHTAQATGGEICREIFTGGSSGNPFVFKVRQSELRFLEEFFSTYFSVDPPIRRGIRLADLNYVTSRQIPSPIRFHELSLYGKGNIEHGISLLKTSQAEDGVDSKVTVLAGGERALRAFSRCAMDTVGPHQLDIVYCYGTYLTRAVRRELEEQWGTSIVDRYALSEVFGGATLDVSTGWYHFEPWVIPEVFDIVHRRPIADGVGVVVLTSLFPFQQAQPIVRYWTGDFARVSHSVPGYCGKPLIQPLGRVGGSILTNRGVPLLFQSEISDTLDHSKHISNIPWFKDNPTANPTKTLGYPSYRVDFLERGQRGADTEIVVSVKWRSSASAEDIESESRRIALSLKQFILEKSPGLESLPVISFREEKSVIPRFAGIYQ